LSHSRWLTTANRVLRLYIATYNPTFELKTIATFVVKVYAPMWFLIKRYPSCKDGSRHLCQLIQLSRYLSDELKEIIDPVIQRNAYASHPENVLLSMITDNRPHIRELGLRRVLKARKEARVGVREYIIPPLNFQANDYVEMIYWQNVKVTEPPVLR
ncbi:hypothetical protein PPYR_01129, partial [Photinus pyralis]